MAPVQIIYLRVIYDWSYAEPHWHCGVNSFTQRFSVLDALWVGRRWTWVHSSMCLYFKKPEKYYYPVRFLLLLWFSSFTSSLSPSTLGVLGQSPTAFHSLTTSWQQHDHSGVQRICDYVKSLFDVHQTFLSSVIEYDFPESGLCECLQPDKGHDLRAKEKKNIFPELSKCLERTLISELQRRKKNLLACGSNEQNGTRLKLWITQTRFWWKTSLTLRSLQSAAPWMSLSSLFPPTIKAFSICAALEFEEVLGWRSFQLQLLESCLYNPGMAVEG